MLWLVGARGRRRGALLWVRCGFLWGEGKCDSVESMWSVSVSEYLGGLVGG